MFWETPFLLLGFLAASTKAVPVPDAKHLLPRFPPDPNLQDLRHGTPPTARLYRGDTRPWSTIAAAGGLFPYVANPGQVDYSVYRHADGTSTSGHGSPYVSASSSESWVQMYARTSLMGRDNDYRATVYVIAPGPNFMSTTEVLQGHLPPDIDDQREYLASGGIPLEQIIGYYVYKRTKNMLTRKTSYQAGTFQANNLYNPNLYPRAISPPDYSLAGFPQGQTKRETTAPTSKKDTPNPQVGGKPQKTQVTNPSGQAPVNTPSSSRPGVKGAPSKSAEAAYFNFIKMLKAKGYKVPFNPKQPTTGRPKTTQGRPTTGQSTTGKPEGKPNTNPSTAGKPQGKPNTSQSN